MRVRGITSPAVRIVILVACIALSARSVWMARADWLSTGSLSDVDRAIQMEPRDPNLIAMAAVYRSNNGDQSTNVERALERSGQLNPLDSRIPMTLGLRAEFRGDLKSAETHLLHAVEMDRQFKPSWTLANFYFRHDEPQKAWPLLRHCLELQPLGFDPGPVFELLWNIDPDAHHILAAVPKRNPRLAQYLAYLVRTNRVTAAADVWPEALALADSKSEVDMGTLLPLPGFLAGGGHAAEAFRMWNLLVDRGMIKAAHLDAARGKTLADPDFQYDLASEPFGWVLVEAAGVNGVDAGIGFRFEIDGNEPESFEMLHTTAAVLPKSDYVLRWEADAADLSAATDPGFAFSVGMDGATETLYCPALLAPESGAGCKFTSGENTSLARLSLSYRRAAGTVRPHGVLRLKHVSLEPAR